MLIRVFLFLLLSVGVIGGGAVAWIMTTPAAVAPVAAAGPAQTTTILAAAHPLRAGALIKPEDLAPQSLAVADMPAGASPDTLPGRTALIGAMVRRSLGEGQAVLPGDVVHPGDHGFLAAVLGPNMRAITVAVDAVSGTAGLIWPGDRVDLILTQTLENPTLTAGRRVAAETVLSDARVIAIDQQIVQGQAPDGTVAPANRTATLEVTAPQAERVLVAGRLGKLALSVLSADRQPDRPADRQADAVAASDLKIPVEVKVPVGLKTPAAAPLRAVAAAGKLAAPVTGERSIAGVTWAGDVSPALGGGETPPAQVKVNVFQGSADSKEFHF